jgi:hypothetical protein
MAVAALAFVAVTSAGCTLTNPQTTELAYQAGDGAEANLGPYVTVASVLVAAENKDGPGALVARVVNDGPDPATVQFQGEGGVNVNVSVRTQPGQTVDVGPHGGQQATINPVGVIPGGLLNIRVSLQGTQDSAVLDVPVLDGTLPEYATLVPSASPSP